MPENIQDLFAKVNITKFSGEIASLVKQEAKIIEATTEKSAELKQVLYDPIKRDSYLLTYEQTLKTVFNKLPATELYLTLDKTKLGSYLNDAFNKFKVSSGGKNVDMLLTPVLGAGIMNFADSAIKDITSISPNDWNDLVDTGLSYLTQQGANLQTIGPDELAQKIKDLENLVPESYLNGLLLNQISQKASELHINNPEQIIITVTTDLKDQFLQKFDSLKTQVDAGAKQAFNELGAHIKTLTDNESKVNTVINKFTDAILERQNDIVVIEEKIKTLIKNSRDIEHVPADLAALAKLQTNHAQLVAENLFHNNILNNYIKQGAGIINTIESYKEKAEKVFTRITDGSYLNEIKNDLEALKQPTLSGVVSLATSVTGDIDQLASTFEHLGVFKGAAQTVSKFVAGAKVAIGIATSLISPNPFGIIGALGSLGGLFGGGGPTIEEEMFKAMQDGFDHINDRLNDIENQINKLAEAVQTMYKSLMQSLQVISNQLDIINEKIELTNSMLNLLIYEDYDLVEALITAGDSITDSIGLELYNRWYIAVPNAIIGLQSLDKLTITSANLLKVIRTDFTQYGGSAPSKVIADYEIKAYSATIALFKQINPDVNANNKLKNLLMLPPQTNVRESYGIGFAMMADKNVYDLNEAIANYLNAIFISQLVEQFIKLHPFYLLAKNNQFEPFSNLDELLQPSSQQRVRDKLILQSRPRLLNFLAVINYSIVQQSILAGYTLINFIDSAFFGNSDANFTVASAAIQANELLAKNMAVYFINTYIETTNRPAFSSLYHEVKADSGKLSAMTLLLQGGVQHKLFFDMDRSNPTNPLLCLYYMHTADAKKIKMPVPDITIIEEKQMIYSDALYALLAAKEKVINALIDIDFFQNLSASQADLYKQVFYTQS